ncbi:MAG: efflux RND transporter periplasmic adaptor subunit [Pseudomonadota bacterium]
MSVLKQLVVLILMALVGYGAYNVVLMSEDVSPEQAGAKQPRVIVVETARAEPRIIAQSVDAVGTTRARQSIQIEPERDGRVAGIYFEPGQRVEQGAVLVKLDDRIARADLAEARARLTEQQQILARIERLRSTNAVALATLEEATARLAEAEAQLERARQGLADRTITAPFAGVVGLPEVDIGAQLEKGDMIARLDDLSEVELEFALPETLYAQVRPELKVEARAAAFPEQPFSGVIAAVDSRIDPVSRSFRARAVIPNPEGVLPAGMFMSLTLTLSESEQLTIPEEAIIFAAAQVYVFRIDVDGIARRIAVSTGVRRDGHVAVLAGLKPGDDVAIRGHQRLKDGAHTRIKVPDSVQNSVDASSNDERDS